MNLRFFVADLVQAARLSRVWLNLGWLDLRLRYRRTILGPFWMILSFGVITVAMGFVYSTLFGLDLKNYLPYLITGLASWAFVQSLVFEGTSVFVASAPIILERKLPLPVHVLRMLVRNSLVLLHSLVVVLLFTSLFGIRYGWDSLFAIPAVATLLLNGLWFALLFGMICARFRDTQQIVQLLLQLVFFVTPVFWHREMLRDRAFIADFNPLFHFIQILRAPLLGQAAPLTSWAVVLAVTLVGWGVTLTFASRWIKRVPYWL